jgi:hypothetical protein
LCLRASGWLLFVLLGVAPAARGALVVLAGGDFFKATTFQVEGEIIRVELSSGGRLVLPLSRVERIVDDEIVVPEDALVAEPSFALRFTAGQEPPPTPYGDLFFESGRRFSLNPALLAAIARAESNFDVGAVSHKGARGLLQLMPATAERFGVSSGDLFDPRRNLEAASRYLVFLIDEFEGDPHKVLAAYNAGEGAVRRYGGVPPYRETQSYVGRVLTSLGD